MRFGRRFWTFVGVLGTVVNHLGTFVNTWETFVDIGRRLYTLRKTSVRNCKPFPDDLGVVANILEAYLNI